MTGSPPPVAGGRALLVVGQNPGYHEDKAGLPFVGHSGAFVRLVIGRYLPLSLHHLGNPHAPSRPVHPVARSAWSLPFEPPPPHFLTTYLGNAARCFTAADAPPPAAYQKCLPYLRTDIEALLAFHSSLIVLCLGAPAAASVLHILTRKKVTLARAFSYNGRTFSHSSKPLTFFATFHPAHVLRTRAMILPMLDHLSLFNSFLASALPAITAPDIVPPFYPRRTPCPPPSPPVPQPTS